MSKEQNEQFIEEVKSDLLVIVRELLNTLNEYYDSFAKSWKPVNKFDFVLGWIHGSIELRYPTEYQIRYGKPMPDEVFFQIATVIRERREEIEEIIRNFLAEVTEFETS